jgi:hypothetical protein
MYAAQQFTHRSPTRILPKFRPFVNKNADHPDFQDYPHRAYKAKTAEVFKTSAVWF